MTTKYWKINLYKKIFAFEAEDKNKAKVIADKITNYSETKENPKLYDKDTLTDAKDEFQSLDEINILTPYGSLLKILVNCNRNGLYIPELSAYNNEFKKVLETICLDLAKSYDGESAKIVYGYELSKIRESQKKIKKIEQYEKAQTKLMRVLELLKEDSDMNQLI